MRRTLLAPTLAAALLLAACGTDSPSTSAGGTTKVAVGVIPIVDVAPIYLGDQKGFFADRGIKLTMQTAQGGAAIVPGVLKGEFQFGFSNMTTLLVAQTSGVPVKVVAAGVSSTGRAGADYSGVTVNADSPIRTAADLAGKKVAVNTLKNIGDTTVRESVRKAGGDASTVKFVELPLPQMPAALAAGQVDAAWVVEPWLSTITKQGGRVVAWNYVDAAPELTVAAYFAATKLIADNPKLVKNFQAAIDESLAYADTHPDEVRKVLGSYLKLDQAIVDTLALPAWPTKINRASVDTLARLGRTDGLFPQQNPDLDKLLP